MQQKVQVRGLTWLLLVHVAVSEDDDSGVLQERIKMIQSTFYSQVDRYMIT